MRSVCVFVLLLGAALAAAAAQEPAPDSDLAKVRREIQELRQAMQAQQKAFDDKMKAMQAELEALQSAKAGALTPTLAVGTEPEKPAEGEGSGLSEEEKKKLEAEFGAALAGEKPAGGPSLATVAAAPTAQPQGSVRLIDVSFDLLVDGGVSTANEDDLRRIQGGEHDPKNRGFTVPNAELTLAGVVDPYFRGDTNIVMKINQDGGTDLELEEAYLTTLSLPANLQVKAGEFFPAFGRINATHPHTWDFVDQPVVIGRLLGPDAHTEGTQLSWLTPLPFFAEVTGGILNANRDTEPSFRGHPGDSVAGRTLGARSVKSWDDLLYLARLKTSFDLTDEMTIVPGLSAFFGPNGTGTDTQTRIYGVDLYAKWKPLNNDKGWPFVAWQSEALYRRYDAAAIFGDLDGDGVNDTRLVGDQTLDDWGFYTQLTWGFARPWVAGLRYDYAVGEHDKYDLLPNFGIDQRYTSAADDLRDNRRRVSADLTFFPSEFSKLRLQFNWDHSTFLDQEDSPADAFGVWLQSEISFGAHGAHKF